MVGHTFNEGRDTLPRAATVDPTARKHPMEPLSEWLGKLEIPPEQLARIAETAKTNPLAAMELLNEYLSPEMLREILAVFLGNPEALALVAEQAGGSAEQLADLEAQFGGPDTP